MLEPFPRGRELLCPALNAAGTINARRDNPKRIPQANPVMNCTRAGVCCSLATLARQGRQAPGSGLGKPRTTSSASAMKLWKLSYCSAPSARPDGRRSA